MALSALERNRLMRRNMLLMMYAVARGNTPSQTTPGALTLLGQEWQGLALDFTDNSYAVRTATGAEQLLGSNMSTAENGLGMDFTDNTYIVRT